MSSRPSVSHTSTRDKNSLQLTNANKWEYKAIDKEEKLSKAMSELNANTRQFGVCWKLEGKLKVEVDACKRGLNVVKKEFAHE